MKFIGRTGQHQAVLTHKLAQLRQLIETNQPTEVRQRRILFTGVPGVGKTELAKLLGRNLVSDKYEFEDLNGANLSIDRLRGWTERSHYRPLTGQITVKFVDEIDAVGTAALNDLRTYLDNLPAWQFFFACTNRKVEDLQEQLQSRFQVSYFIPVPAEEIRELLAQTFPLIPAATVRDIAFGVKGNVRAALTDCESQMDVINYQRQAA